MRAEQQSYAGYFWRSNLPEKKVPGTLTVVDGGKVYLEVLGTFDERTEHFNRRDPVPRVLGEIEGGKRITLENCSYLRKPGLPGFIAKSKLRAECVYIGVVFDDGEEVQLRSFQFSVEGLDAWHSISGITTNYEPKTHAGSITYERPRSIELWSDGEINLSLSFGHRGPTLGKPQSATIAQSSYFGLAK